MHRPVRARASRERSAAWPQAPVTASVMATNLFALVREGLQAEHAHAARTLLNGEADDNEDNASTFWLLFGAYLCFHMQVRRREGGPAG